jgi:hypothetical protein
VAIQAAGITRLHLEVHNLDVELPADENWSVRKFSETGSKDLDLLSREMAGAQGPQKLELWRSERFQQGGDMVIRDVPAQPDFKMLIGGVANPPAACSAAIQAEASRGNQAVDGVRFVPASWHRQVARNAEGAIVGCMDLKGALLTVMIIGKAGATDADFAGARTVLESLTAAIPADRR